MKEAIEYIGEVNNLWTASYFGVRAVIERILERGYANDTVDANIADNGGKAPLIVAAEEGHIGIVRMLMDSGKADFNARDDYCRTALTYCFKRWSPVHAELAKLFLDTNGINLNILSRTLERPRITAIDHGWEDTFMRVIG